MDVDRTLKMCGAVSPLKDGAEFGPRQSVLPRTPAILGVS